MKTNLLKKIFALALVLVLALSFAACSNEEANFEPDLSDLPEIEDLDVEELIEDFAEESHNVVELETGEKERLFGSNVALSNGGECYTTDDSVATVSDSGTVTAKGQGACYIIVVGVGAPDWLIEQQPDVDHRKIEVYKIMVDVPASMGLKSFFGGMDSEAKGLMSMGLTIMGVVFAAGVALIIIIIVAVKKANKTNAPGFDMPQFQAPDFNSQVNGVNQVNAQPGGKFCGNCGQQVEDGNAFCPYCGSKM